MLSYISTNKTLHFSARVLKIKEVHPGKICYASGNRNPRKASYITRNGNPEKILHISENGTLTISHTNI